MRRLFTLVSACLVMSLVFASAAGAQGVAASRSEGAPPAPAYVLEKDGTVINNGDLITDCQSLITGLEQGCGGAGKEQARMVADKCRELGIPSGDLATGDSEVVLSLGTEGPPAPLAEELPDTGGPLLIELAALITGLALIGGGLMLRRSRS